MSDPQTTETEPQSTPEGTPDVPKARQMGWKRRISIGSLVGLATVLVLWSAGCTDSLLGPTSPQSRADLFDQIWLDFDKRYSHFEVKDVDWKALRSTYRSKAIAASSDREFFDVIAEMMDVLEDGHVNLYAPFDTYQYTGYFEGFPRSFDEQLLSQELSNLRFLSNTVQVADVSAGIAYVRVRRFGGQASDFSVLDNYIATLRDRRAVIVDVRDNPGGSDDNARTVARRFIEKRALVRYVKYRNGPSYSDFTALVPDYIKPDDKPIFTGPTYVLTNRRCASTTESFVLMMKTRPNTLVVGDRTGGSTGSPVSGELSNGWSYRFSSWVQLTPDGIPTEGNGIAPDVRVTFGEDASRDQILRAAVDTATGEEL